MRSRSQRWAATTLLVCSLAGTGCSHWKRQWIDPARVVERDHPTVLRVWRLDGTGTEIRNPVVAGDSLVSESYPGSGAPSASSPSWVALRDIDYVEAKRQGDTAGILVLGLLLPLTIAAIAVASMEE